MSMSPEEGVSKLTSILMKIHGFLQMREYDEDLRDELSKKLPNYMDILENRKKDIMKRDSSIVVAGETSSGKTTLINSLVGDKIFVASNVAATGKICRIRNSEILACKYYTKEGEEKGEENVADVKELKKIIKRGTTIGSMSEEDQQDIYFVDVLQPFPILEGSVIIVDTPGIGENQELDKILLDFLPDAVSFVFVVNARNAGGVQEGRLLRILGSIIANREKMPCFNPKEALFVTNQWDIVEDDTDDDDNEETEGGKEKTWRIIKEKLTKGWIEVDEENIFRVSLKQVMSNIPNEHSGEYNRFREFLDRNIKRNVHSRLKNHFRFLEIFMQYAEIGTLARLEYLSKSEEDKRKEIKKSREKIDAMESECKKKKDEFIKDLNSKLDHLANELWRYLNSSRGKWRILNRDGLKLIKNVSYSQLASEIPKRVEEGVKSWCRGKECTAVVTDAQNRIQTYLQEISVQFQECTADIIGVKVYDNSYDVAKISAAIGILALFPFTVAVGALLSIIFAPAYFAIGYYIGKEITHKGKVEEIFAACIHNISKEDLRTKFAESFGAEYRKMIQKIFGEDIPNEIRVFRVTLTKLESEQLVLKGKEGSLRTLQKETVKIRGEMTKMRNSLSEITDQ